MKPHFLVETEITEEGKPCKLEAMSLSIIWRYTYVTKQSAYPNRYAWRLPVPDYLESPTRQGTTILPPGQDVERRLRVSERERDRKRLSTIASQEWIEDTAHA